ncbi:MAG: SseB family protein [Pseudomonadota bacterium]
MTPLDTAHAAMHASGTDEDRLSFFGRVAEAELSLVLDSVGEDTAKPRLIEVEGARYVLAFDTELRMAEFCGQETRYLSTAGRQIAAMLAGQGVGLALNLGTPSAHLIPPETVSWLRDTLSTAPEIEEDRPVAVHPPRVPEELITALDAKLATLEGIADVAWLADLEYEGGRRTATLAFAGAPSFVEPAIAAAIDEALKFSSAPVSLEVLFVDPSAPILGPFSRQGLRFDLPQPQMPGAPGSNPAKPPRLI